jgi:hypothetical protein
MPTSVQVLRQARKRLGIQENPPKSNRTSIGREFGWNGVPWCAETVCVCLLDAGFHIRKTASAPGLYSELRSYAWKEATFSTARAGDVIFFSWPGTSSTIDHTGIVEGRTKDGRLITIEGNTTLANGNDGVARRIRARSCVAKVVRPPYRKTAS